MTPRAWVALPDQLSIRVFLDTGILAGLQARLDHGVEAIFLVRPEEAATWEARLDGIRIRQGDELTSGQGSGQARVLRLLDASLDRRIGYHPLAIRLNYRHGFHLERMQKGHANWMLDSARAGPLPRWSRLEHAMERWHFSLRRHVPARLLEEMRRECSALVLSNVQPHAAVPYLVAARKLGLPVVAYVASWDHTVGKGMISPYCDRYVVQNEVMQDDLERYHGIGPDRVVVTGWPQTDMYHHRHSRAEYADLLRVYGLDPSRPLVLVMGNTPTNTPYEHRFVERLVAWWEEHAGYRFQLLLRPHPRDGEWRERFAAAMGRDGAHVQKPSYTDLEELATLLQHGDVVVANAGTILLDALVNERPAVCVLYDEGAPPGESWAAKNVIGKHYEELAASGAFYRAESFDEVVGGIDRALTHPAELAAARQRVVREVVGEVDGRAAERAVDAIVGGLGGARA